MRMSQSRAMASPPPAATPLTAAMVGFGTCSSSTAVLNSGSGPLVGQGRWSASARSAPEQKARPAPVRTNARPSGSAENSPTKRRIS